MDNMFPISCGNRDCKFNDKRTCQLVAMSGYIALDHCGMCISFEPTEEAYEARKS